MINVLHSNLLSIDLSEKVRLYCFKLVFSMCYYFYYYYYLEIVHNK